MSFVYRGIMVLLAMIAFMFESTDTAIYILLLAILTEMPERDDK